MRKVSIPNQLSVKSLENQDAVFTHRCRPQALLVPLLYSSIRSPSSRKGFFLFHTRSSGQTSEDVFLSAAAEIRLIIVIERKKWTAKAVLSKGKSQNN